MLSTINLGVSIFIISKPSNLTLWFVVKSRFSNILYSQCKYIYVYYLMNYAGSACISSTKVSGM